MADQTKVCSRFHFFTTLRKILLNKSLDALAIMLLICREDNIDDSTIHLDKNFYSGTV